MKKSWFLAGVAIAYRIISSIIASFVAYRVIGYILLVTGILSYGTIFVKHYETANIEDYGQYIGNYDNQSVETFINSFFPEEIDPAFENVNYIYRAKKFDAYAFEAWLEFNIQDEDAFQSYIGTVTKGEQLQTFAYDDAYSEYVIAESFELHPNAKTDDDPSDGYSIQYAKIGKILINDEKNEIIYYALGVYDGGGVHTDYLRQYFTRFNIDPLQYDEITKDQGKGDGSVVS